MSIELWIDQEFDTSHERRALDYFLSELANYDQSDEYYFVLANYYMKGRQIDLTILKRNAIIVVELKEYPDPFHATENGNWLSISDEQVLGSNGQNPFNQVTNCRYKWIAFLKEKQNQFLPTQKAQRMRLDHVSAFVAISPSLHPASRIRLPRSSWFQLIGLDELAKTVQQQASPSLNFSKQELNTLVTDVLHLSRSNIKRIGDSHKKPDLPKNSPYQHFKESTYPPDHHLKDVQAIKRVIDTNNSLLVNGLSGSGKSSVLRFLVSNPAVQSEGMVFIYIDCNVLDWERDKEAVQEEICSQIIENLQLQNLGIETSSSNKNLARDNLRLLIKKIAADGPEHLVVVFDRSELLRNELSVSFFNYLRALRDINPSLSYIFAGRDLTPHVFDELADVLWNEPHWIGKLGLDDARTVLSRHLTRLKINLKDEEMEKILQCIGRHPQLLKYSCELVRAKKVQLNDDEAVVIDQFLMSPLIKRQCNDLWQDLDSDMKKVLCHIAHRESPSSFSSIEELMHCGILDFSEDNEVVFTSELFRCYVNNLSS